MEQTKFIFTMVLLVFLIAACSSEPSEFDNFAQCLTDNGVTMYGAYWCPHCQNQKEMFGKSFENVIYVECSLPNRAGQTQACKDAKINAYPTWEFKDGERVEGEVSLQGLSQKTGCRLV